MLKTKIIALALLLLSAGISAQAQKRNFIVTMEELPESPSEHEEESEWLELWQKYLFSLALEELKQQVSGRHFQIFQLCKNSCFQFFGMLDMGQLQ